MAPRNSLRLSRLTLLYLGLITFTLIVGTIVNADCDSTCCYPPVESRTAGKAWPPDATVNVYISSTDFPTDGEQNAIKKAFTNWQNAAGTPGNGSNVSFNFVITPNPPVQGTAENQFIVKRGETTNGAYSNVGTSPTVVQSAVTYIDSEVTNWDVMTDTMAHEIGHTFGLGDLPLSGLHSGRINHGAKNLQRITILRGLYTIF